MHPISSEAGTIFVLFLTLSPEHDMQNRCPGNVCGFNFVSYQARRTVSSKGSHFSLCNWYMPRFDCFMRYPTPWDLRLYFYGYSELVIRRNLVESHKGTWQNPDEEDHPGLLHHQNKLSQHIVTIMALKKNFFSFFFFFVCAL